MHFSGAFRVEFGSKFIELARVWLIYILSFSGELELPWILVLSVGVLPRESLKIWKDQNHACSFYYYEIIQLDIN